MHVAHKRKLRRSVYNILLGETEGKRLLGRGIIDGSYNCS
jgi:hypothetical protein